MMPVIEVAPKADCFLSNIILRSCTLIQLSFQNIFDVAIGPMVRVDAVKAAIKINEVKILNGVNPWEKPEELAQVMIDFLK